MAPTSNPTWNASPAPTPSKQGRTLVFFLGAMAGAPVYAQTAPVPPQGDPVRGQVLYGACMGCHSLDDNDIGPKHRGVVGRKAGTVADYAYSSALKASGIVWDSASLNLWLTNPQKLVPGAKMYFSIPDPQSRADIISYLEQQK